jgi:hypothetical protein
VTPLRAATTAIVLYACALRGAGVTVSLADSRGACREVSLPKWKSPALPVNSYDWSYLLHGSPTQSDWDFRAFEGGVLVGLYVIPNYVTSMERGPRRYSAVKYAIDTATGKVRRVTEGEWADAKPYLPLRDSPLGSGLVMRPTDRLTFHGRDFARRGAQWPLTSQDAARVSQDGAFLAVNGWDGYVSIGGDLASWPGNGDHSQGNYYSDVYDVGSGTIAFSITGHFSGARSDPQMLFMSSGWFSKRYYVFQLDHEQMNRFVVCDVAKIAQ